MSDDPGTNPDALWSGAAVATRLPAADLDRAERWYADKLGLRPAESRAGGRLYRMAQGSFALFQSGGTSSGTHTQMAFEVADLRTAIEVLQGRGVVFEEQGIPGVPMEGPIATVDGNYPSKGSAELGSWFRDSEGNLLGLGQPLP